MGFLVEKVFKVNRKNIFPSLRERIYIPDKIANDNIKTDAPFCYRDLDTCLGLIDNLIKTDKRFSVFAYLGQM